LYQPIILFYLIMAVIHKYRKFKNIKALPLLKYSGYFPKTGAIKCPKKHQYYIVTNVIIPGDAPKDFIKYYHYKNGRKDRPKTWPSYIAKLGHKHYPVESITEYLLNRIGEVLGLNMAKSELGWFGGQIRFLSKYFISKRRSFIKKCLKYRHEKIKDNLNFASL
jgi:hypothetical protein